MRKILVLANDETTIYNFRREIIENFCNVGFEVYVAYPTGDNTESIKKLGCKVIDCKVSRHGTNVFEDLKLFFKYIKIIRTIEPNLVLTYTVKPNIYGSLACQFTKTSYMNNITGLGSVLQSDSIFAKLILFLQKIAYKKSKCVFFQNSDNYKTFVDKKVITRTQPIRLLPGSGVNLKLHSFEEYPIEEIPVKFVFISRIRKDKGIDELFQAVRDVKETYEDRVEFHIIGWYEEEKYKTIIEKLSLENLIIYHGKKMQEEVHEILKSCHCIVHPSYHEGMSNVLLEAAATGRPIIASNIPGCMETFSEGKSGYGFEVKNPMDLEETLKEFIELPYEKKAEMGVCGRRKIEKEFDRNLVAKIYIEEIKKNI